MPQDVGVNGAAAGVPSCWLRFELDRSIGAPILVAAAAVWLSRTTGESRIALACADGAVRAKHQRLAPLASRPVVAVDLASPARVEDLRDQIATAIQAGCASGPWLNDAIDRHPSLRRQGARPLVVVDIACTGGEPAVVREPGSIVHLCCGDGLATVEFDSATVAPNDAARFAEQIAGVVRQLQARTDGDLNSVTVATADELALLTRLNDTGREVPANETIADSFRRQAAATPDAPALSAGDTTMTYSELLQAAEEVAAALRAAGVRRLSRVGLALLRDADLLPCVFGVLLSGASYVPLDLAFPHERLRTVVEDAEVDVIIAFDPQLGRRLAGPDRPVLTPASIKHTAGTDALTTNNGSAMQSGAGSDEARSEDPAYVIYTSGSTGTPKGVVVEHRNVINFFVAMDEVIEHRNPGRVAGGNQPLVRHLACSSCSGRSARGFHVVLRPDAATLRAQRTSRVGGPTFSLFYFASAEADSANGYQLLLDGARFADEHGFEAVWTPERHFHAFGGIYPNPSVTSAAVAAITQHVAIRAGSVVLAAAFAGTRRRGMVGRRQPVERSGRDLARRGLAAQRLRAQPCGLRRRQAADDRRGRRPCGRCGAARPSPWPAHAATSRCAPSHGPYSPRFPSGSHRRAASKPSSWPDGWAATY